MWACVCLCARVCVWLLMFASVCVCVCVYPHMHVSLYGSMRACTSVRMRLLACTYARDRVFCARLWVYVCIKIEAYINKIPSTLNLVDDASCKNLD